MAGHHPKGDAPESVPPLTSMPGVQPATPPVTTEAAIDAGLSRVLAQAARYKKERDNAALLADRFDAQCEVHWLARQSAESRLETVTAERDALLLDVAARQRDVEGLTAVTAAVGRVIGRYEAEEVNGLAAFGDILSVFETAEILADPDTMAAIAEGEGAPEVKP
jgi:hypothetical protein